MPRMRLFCKACGEPTTHQKQKIDGKDVWVCQMCQVSKAKTPEELEKLKQSRKGWKTDIT